MERITKGLYKDTKSVDFGGEKVPVEFTLTHTPYGWLVRGDCTTPDGCLTNVCDESYRTKKDAMDAIHFVSQVGFYDDPTWGWCIND